MKMRLALSIVLLLAALPSYASHTQTPSASSQLRLRHSHASESIQAVIKAAQRPFAPAIAPPRMPIRPNHPPSALPFSKRRFSQNAITPLTTTGLVAGIQLPLLGEDDDNTYDVMGDFNGDGKPDVAKIVYNNDGLNIYEISVVLSNGDGTFQAAQLTATPGNTDDPIVVGDVNGDGKDDLIMIHSGSECGPVHQSTHRSSASPQGGCGSSFDVLLSNGDGTFTIGNNYSLSEYNLNGGVLADLNGDGKLDVLTIDSDNPAGVWVALGNGDGTFQAATQTTSLTGSAPGNLFFADFNGDGKLDFAGLNSGQVEVYLASGSSYAAPVALTTSDETYAANACTAGDLTSAGKPDIVCANTDANTLSVFVNNGEGSFATGVYYNDVGGEYAYPYAPTIADVNGDGHNDVVIGSEYGGTISVFLGNGDGTVNLPTLGYGIGGYVYRPPLVADFNGDGLLDVIEPDDWFSLVYLEGYGDGSFRSSVTYNPPQNTGIYTYIGNVATGDFNGDGFADVVEGVDGDTNAPGILVYLSNGDGTLQLPVNYGTSSTLYFAVIADFNGDNKLDIAATDYSNGVVQIFLGKGDGTFTVGSTYATDTAEGPAPFTAVAGDFNHDGKVDLAILNQQSQTIGILFGNGDGTFSAPHPISMGGYTRGIATADVNGDGYLDLVSIFDQGNAQVFLGNTDNSGTFQPPLAINLGSGYPNSLALGDVNGDGKIDIVGTMDNGTYPSAFVVALGNGDGTFQSANSYASSVLGGGLVNAGAEDIVLADSNGDGKLDLIYNNDEFGTVAIAYGNGDGTFATPTDYPSGAYTAGLAVGDLTGDGTLDVVDSSYYTASVNVLLNAADSIAGPNFKLTTQTTSQTVAAGAPATYNLTVAGIHGYTGAITLSCSGLPAHAVCSFSPSSVTTNGNQSVATVLTITTSGASADLIRPVRPNSKSVAPTLLASLTGFGLFGLVLAGYGKKSRWAMSMVTGMVVLILMFTMVACGGSGSSDTAAGTYTINVTSTGTGTNAPTHTVPVTLIVQ